MDLSETIVAAIIGALATVITAVFQLIRNRSPSESKPKKNRMRSALATVALGIACIVGGYAWSSLRAVSANQEIRATMRAEMKAEFAEQFAALVARKEAVDAEAARALDGGAFAARHGERGVAESLAHLKPCRIDAAPEEVGPVTCTDRAAQGIALCATVPSASQASNLRVFARVPLSESGWEEREPGAPTLGSLHIAEAPVEYPVSADQRSVCLDVSNWSVDDTLAVRLVVEYEFPAKPAVELTAATPGAATL